MRKSRCSNGKRKKQKMGVTIRRRTNLGYLKGLGERIQQVAADTLSEAKAEIEQEIEANLSGRMVNARNAEPMPGREKVGEWYRIEEEAGPRSNSVVVTVEDGIPTLLHRGVPHSWTIEAKDKKALHWVDEKTGEDVFAQKVTHPPLEPRPFAEDAVRTVARKIAPELRRRVRETLRGR